MARTSPRDAADLLVKALPATTRLVASAVGGDRRALERVVSYQAAVPVVERHGVGSLLARRAGDHGMSGSCLGIWQTAARRTRELNGRSSAALTGLSGALASAGLPWALMGPAAVATTVHEDAADRPVDSLQLLIAPQDLSEARRVLGGVGWVAELGGAGYEGFLPELGFVWSARSAAGLRLQLFFRLWPWTPERLQREMMRRAEQDPALGRAGYRTSLVDAYLCGAQEVWTGAARRSLLAWWDLHRIVEHGGRTVARDAYREARRYGMHLPVGLSAAMAAGLWGHAGSWQVAELLAELSGWERMVVDWLRLRGPEGAVARGIHLARQLSGRELRGGWGFQRRVLWAHRGIVEDQTPESWWWPLRRARHCAERSVSVLRGSLDPTMI